MYKQNIGKIGEKYALKILRNSNYKILHTNYKTIFGEIDIIALKKDELIFFEVKTRTNDIFGYPYESVSKDKINKIIKCIEIYKNQHQGLPDRIRIDVVSILLYPSGEVKSFEILHNVCG